MPHAARLALAALAALPISAGAAAAQGTAAPAASPSGGAPAPYVSPSPSDVMRIASESLPGGLLVLRGYTNGNVLAVPTRGGLLLVDAQSTKRVAEADSALRRQAGVAPVRWVVLTHYHGDHIEGAAHWRAAGAEVIAQRNLAVQARKDTVVADMNNWHREPAAAASLPTREVGDSTALELGGERVVLLHMPNAHTDGDLVVWLPRRNVIHAGDIVELDAFPFIDWWAGGTLDGMIAATDRILALADDRTLIVPGHGHTAIGKRDVAAYRAMLATARERLRALAASGKTIEEVVAAAPLAEYTAGRGADRHTRRFTAIAYYGITGKHRANKP